MSFRPASDAGADAAGARCRPSDCGLFPAAESSESSPCARRSPGGPAMTMRRHVRVDPQLQLDDAAAGGGGGGRRFQVGQRIIRFKWADVRVEAG
jgi:hypothetical protein